MLRILIAGLVLACAGPAARALAQAGAESSPDESELAADAAIWKLGSDTATRSVRRTTRGRFLYDLQLNLAFTATGKEPETQLDYDVVTGPLGGTQITWRTAELGRPRPAQHFPSSMLSAGAEWEASEIVLVRALVDSGELRDGATLDPPSEGLVLSGTPWQDALSSFALVRELSVTLGHPALQLELGRFRAQVADGLVYDDFGTGARARVDFGAMQLADVRAEVFASSIGQRFDDVRHDPIAGARIEYAPSFFDSIGLFAAGVIDSDGVLSAVMRSTIAERVLDHPALLRALFASDEGEGRLGYVGADAALSLGRATLLRATTALCAGRFALTLVDNGDPALDRALSFDVLGGAASVELRRALGNAFELGLHAFALSGDKPPRNGKTYHGFIGAAPYWVWTGLFFSGGLNQSLFANRSAVAGVHGHGVFGAGPSLAWRAHKVDAELRAIWLQALANAPASIGGGGTSYGLESDLRAQWEAYPWLWLGAELDLLFASTYFPERSVAYRALSVATLRYAN